MLTYSNVGTLSPVFTPDSANTVKPVCAVLHVTAVYGPLIGSGTAGQIPFLKVVLQIGHNVGSQFLARESEIWLAEESVGSVTQLIQTQLRNPSTVSVLQLPSDGSFLYQFRMDQSDRMWLRSTPYFTHQDDDVMLTDSITYNTRIVYIWAIVLRALPQPSSTPPTKPAPSKKRRTTGPETVAVRFSCNLPGDASTPMEDVDQVAEELDDARNEETVAEDSEMIVDPPDSPVQRRLLQSDVVSSLSIQPQEAQLYTCLSPIYLPITNSTSVGELQQLAYDALASDGALTADVQSPSSIYLQVFDTWLLEPGRLLSSYNFDQRRGLQVLASFTPPLLTTPQLLVSQICQTIRSTAAAVQCQGVP